MTTRAASLFAALAGLLLAGCATAQPDESFGGVQSAVLERTGRRVHWDRGSPADQDAAAAVRAMLSRELGPDDAVQVALLNNRNLQAVYEDLGVAQAEVVQAGLLRNPVFDADVKFLEGGGGHLIELSVVQDFLDVFFIPLRKRIAAHALEAAKLRVTGAALDLVGEVRQAYFAHVAAGQALDLRRTVAAATEASYDLASRLRAAGNITALDLANERALHEQAKLDLAAAESAALDTRERLNVLLGVWGPDTAWTTSARLADPPAEELPTDDVERRAVERSVELAAARHQVEAAARTLGLRHSLALLPEAEGGVAAEHESDGEWSVGPAFSLPIPLFDQGQATTAAARSELRRSRRRYYAKAVEVRSAARAARNRLLAARARAEYLRRVILPLRQEITRQTQLQYNAMLVGPFQLLQARQAEIEAGVQYVDSLREYWTARGALQQVESGRTGGIRASGATNPGSASRSAGSREAGDH